MEAPLGYLDEKDTGVQKLKRGPDTQVWTGWAGRLPKGWAQILGLAKSQKGTRIGGGGGGS